MNHSTSSSLTLHIAIVIPAFNEANTITKVVAETSLYGKPIVINDGSSDKTASLAKKAGAIVVEHTVNQGYDAALSTGLFKALTAGFTYAITFDADGQHAPYILKKFTKTLDNGADLVIGVRDHYQRFSESIFSVVGNKLWKVQDPLCGMKGYKLSHLATLGFFKSYNSIGTEFSLRAAKSNLNVQNIPIPTLPRVGQSRFGSGLLPNIKILRALILGIFMTSAFKK